MERGDDPAWMRVVLTGLWIVATAMLVWLLAVNFG